MGPGRGFRVLGLLVEFRSVCLVITGLFLSTRNPRKYSMFTMYNIFTIHMVMDHAGFCPAAV